MPAPEVAAETAGPWSSKIRQYETVSTADPDLSFDVTVLSDERELARHLAARCDRTVVLRPEVSDDTGSALFQRPDVQLPESEIAALWARGGRVLAHDHVAGTPCFVNGVLFDGELAVTDSWRCFLLEVGHRSVLTSVVNFAPGSPKEQALVERLGPVIREAGLREGPVHFELVACDDGGVKVVKFAARVAGHPLPTLCRHLGMPDQAAVLAGGPELLAARPGSPGYVADYAFVVRTAGRLVRFEGLDEIRALPSYAADILVPSPGDMLELTAQEVGDAALLLRHHDEDVLLADIAFCQKLNRRGVFHVTAAQ